MSSMFRDVVVTWLLCRDNRELVLQRLQEVLAGKDHDLALLQQSHQALTEEVAELRRTNRREGVNMDYLKHVVLQYMSFSQRSTERRTLVPVIAMLLQFSRSELLEIDRTETDPSWNPKPTKELVKRNGASPYTSPLISSPSGKKTFIPPAPPDVQEIAMGERSTTIDPLTPRPDTDRARTLKHNGIVEIETDSI
jgi:hypothetical protein